MRFEMIKILFLPILSAVLLAAHFSRVQQDWLALLALLLPLILLIKRPWIIRVYQIFLACGGVIWIERAFQLRSLRIAEERPWIRLVIILGVVALITLFSASLLQCKKLRAIYQFGEKRDALPHHPGLFAFLLTASLLTVVHFQVKPPILLLERFFPGSFGIEIFALSLYAALVTEKMLDIKKTPKTRGWIWLFFSAVFFIQFFLGIMGIDKLLMTGKLHLPIPAMIMAGPIFRGHGFFMLILFTATVILAGSAWCSHLCYIGGWDNWASRSIKKPKSLPSKWRSLRFGFFIIIVLSALLFRLLGVDPLVVTGIAMIYGLGGAGVMVFLSKRNGVMTHCTLYCPMGLVADFLGRFSPFRIHFNPACDECGACQHACRYHALQEGDIQRKKPGISCTLCGDCLQACPKRALHYKFPGLSPWSARIVFITLIVSLHAVFLGVARL